jgi:hypothetical protein
MRGRLSSLLLVRYDQSDDKSLKGCDLARAPYVRGVENRLSGICLLRGPNIVTEAGLQDAEIKDVAPTILYLMEEPIPDDMDGRVLTEAITPEYLAANPIETVPAEDTSREPDLVAYDDQEHQTVQDRLRDLGYID